MLLLIVGVHNVVNLSGNIILLKWVYLFCVDSIHIYPSRNYFDFNSTDIINVIWSTVLEFLELGTFVDKM